MTRLPLVVWLPVVLAVAVLGTWYLANGLETSNPYPATYYWCGAETVQPRTEFVRECVTVWTSPHRNQVEMIPWCEEMSKGIYCRPESGFRYSRVRGPGMVEQSEVQPCSGAMSEAERLVCGKVVR